MVREESRIIRTKLTCDRCGEELNSMDDGSNNALFDEWSHLQFDRSNLALTRNLLTLDLCSECTKTFVKVFMAKEGSLVE